MPRIKNDSPQSLKPEPRVYTKEELERFDKSISRFYEDYTIQTGSEKDKIIKVLNHDKLCVAFGAMSERGGVYPERYAVFTNLMKQWDWWKSGKEWIEKAKLDQLDEISKQVYSEKKQPTSEDMDELFDKF